MQVKKLLRLLGGKKEHLEGARVATIMLAATALYAFASSKVVPGYAFSAYEFLGTWTGLVCVWLSRTQNVLCWPWGIASSLLLGAFFRQIGLPGQQWLNWGYFVAIQLWAWPHWAFGGEAESELPVTSMSWQGRAVTVAGVVLGTLVVFRLIDVFAPGSAYPWLDALVVTASVIAQFLMGRKKVESWVLWLGPVNVISVALFFVTGAYTVAALYVAFLIHAAFALRTWAKADNRNAYVQSGTGDRKVLSAAQGA